LEICVERFTSRAESDSLVGEIAGLSIEIKDLAAEERSLSIEDSILRKEIATLGNERRARGAESRCLALERGAPPVTKRAARRLTIRSFEHGLESPLSLDRRGALAAPFRLR
jgi:hypothetical protein